MPHRFEDAEAWSKRFDDPTRDAWQKPEALIDGLGLSPESRVADLGAGTGYFAVRLAKRLPAGRVYGVDVEPDMVRFLAARARREGLANLDSRLAAPDDPLLPAPVDLVLIVDTYHHLSDRVRYFERLKASLAPGGRVAIVDFRAGTLPVGPPEDHRILPPQLDAELAAAGFVRERLDEALLPYQYVAIYGVAKAP